MKWFVVTVLLFMCACPSPITGKVDPYLTARTIINQSQTALALADGIFNQWKLGQTDTEKVERAARAYQKIKAGVTGGLQLALNGVDIAEQAEVDPNVKALLTKANAAWQTLRTTLAEILTLGDKVDIVAVSTSPVVKTIGPVGKKTATLKGAEAKKNPVDQLPKKLPGS